MTTFFSFPSSLLSLSPDENKTEVKVMKVRTLKYPYSGVCYSVGYRLLKPTQNLFFLSKLYVALHLHQLLMSCIYLFIIKHLYLHIPIGTTFFFKLEDDVISVTKRCRISTFNFFIFFFFNLKQYIALLYTLLVNVAVLLFTLRYYCLLFHLYSSFDAKSKDSLLLSMTYSS